jgi:cobalt-zinc-cadmium efflux system outer membrane protein
LRVLASTFVFLLFASAVRAQIPQPSPPVAGSLTLEAAFERAINANPALIAARTRRAVDLASVSVAGERPNPELHAEFEKETPKQSFGLAVPLELGGKRSNRVAVANATLQVGEAELARAIVDIRAQVRRAYFAGVVAEERLALLDDLRSLAGRARDAAQARFDVGSAPQLELLQGQLAVALTENETNVARATAQSAKIAINALLGLPAEAPITLVTALDDATVLAPPVALTRAQQANAELALLDRQIAEQQARISLADALRTLDVTPDFTFTRDSNPEFMYGWRFAVGAVIPLFTSHRAQVQVEQALLTQLNAQRVALLSRITADVTAASTVADAQRAAYLRYRDDIIPAVIEVERMAEDSYRLGQSGITALLQSLQASRDLRLRSLQAAQDFQNALGELERAIGAPIP